MKKTLYYRFWEGIAHIVFPKRTLVFEEKPAEGEVAVFVSNHAGAIGPANLSLYFDRPFRPWIISYMFDKDVAPNFIYHDFLFARGSKHKRFNRFLARLVSILLPPLLSAQGGIKVYRTGIEVLHTFKDSINALNNGENLVIFPECPTKHSRYTCQFSEGFVDLGKLYFESTGKILKFYPVYVPNQLKTINVGKPIAYDPTALRDSERTRISDALIAEIDRIGDALPPHETVPYKPDAYYKYYAEYVDNQNEYWKLCEQKRSE